MDHHSKVEASADFSRSADFQFLESSPLNEGFTGWRLSSRSHAWRPPTDVYEAEETLQVRVEIAGMREADFAIELNGRLLTIRGLRQETSERERLTPLAKPAYQRVVHQMEIRFGEFNIELELPFPVDTEQVQATYSDGFLRVTLPKARPRTISINE